MNQITNEIEADYKELGFQVKGGNGVFLAWALRKADARPDIEVFLMLLGNVEFKVLRTSEYTLVSPYSDPNLPPRPLPRWAQFYSLSYPDDIELSVVATILNDRYGVFNKAWDWGRKELRNNFAGMMGLVQAEQS